MVQDDLGQLQYLELLIQLVTVAVPVAVLVVDKEDVLGLEGRVGQAEGGLAGRRPGALAREAGAGGNLRGKIRDL